VPADCYLDVATPLLALGVAASEPGAVASVPPTAKPAVMWDNTPIDLFFAYDAFHDAAAGGGDRCRSPP